ncbi:MAG: CHRD domain-containing protein [Gammaproteobacteria bacterium]|nr:CHRD domain-containing protein [Gammaproteobacteria bacterium]
MNRVLIALAVLLIAAAPGANAASIVYASSLGPEVLGATGSGSVTLIYDDVAQTLDIAANFTGLSGTTTVAHIHCCVAVAGTGTVGVAVTPGTLPGFPVGVTAGSYATVIDLTDSASYTGAFLTGAGGTAALAEAALIAGLDAGKAYFNVHSSTFGGGEIRGFPVIPVPAAFWLFGSALGVMGWLRRNRTS